MEKIEFLLKEFKKQTSELKWTFEVQELANDREAFYKRFIEREEYDNLLSQWENTVAELKYYKKKTQQLEAENRALRREVGVLKGLLKESWALIENLRQEVAKKAISCLKTFIKIAPQKKEVQKTVAEIKKATEEKSELRRLIEARLRESLNEVSKSDDVDTSKDWTFSKKV